MNIRAVNWAAQTVGVYALVLGPEGESQRHTPPIEFTLSPYSFPFSDNTLLPSGNRFGIYLTRIDIVPDVLQVMRLSFVWFPKDFVLPRRATVRPGRKRGGGSARGAVAHTLATVSNKLALAARVISEGYLPARLALLQGPTRTGHRTGSRPTGFAACCWASLSATRSATPARA